jgi:hypothetical protein
LRAHGSLGRKEASAYFLSRDAYSQVGDEQKDGRPSKSGIVISALWRRHKGRHDLLPGAVLQHFGILGAGIVMAHPMGNPAYAAGGRAVLLRGPHAHGRILSKQYANANRARLNGDKRFIKVARNRLLLALPSRNLKRLMPELEQIRCQRAQILMDADSSLDNVFFPDSGVVSACKRSWVVGSVQRRAQPQAAISALAAHDA